MTMIATFAAALLATHSAQPASRIVPSAVVSDPAPDAAHPAGMSPVLIPTPDGPMNGVIYLASGAGPHPTLLLLHGFPGNEQNLDLAQAARRAGWHVLTLHYRGSWGSAGAFGFARAAEDAHLALAFLRDPATVRRFGIDPGRIAVAGHSMGGFMAADAGADDARVLGAFLIDPWAMSDTAAALRSPEGQRAWREEVESDLPALSGTSYQALTDEITRNAARFDLSARVRAFGRRPVLIVGAERGGGNEARRTAAAAPGAQLLVWPTDHPFSDHRIALASLLVTWLESLGTPGR